MITGSRVPKRLSDGLVKNRHTEARTSPTNLRSCAELSCDRPAKREVYLFEKAEGPMHPKVYWLACAFHQDAALRALSEQAAESQAVTSSQL